MLRLCFDGRLIGRHACVSVCVLTLCVCVCVCVYECVGGRGHGVCIYVQHREFKTS